MMLNTSTQGMSLPGLFGWNWLHWLVLLVVMVIAGNEVIERQSQRVRQVDATKIEVLEEDINEYNTMAERLATMEVLPPVKEQWNYVVAIAKKYGVDMRYTSDDTPYRGPLKAWGGRVSGSTGPVLVVAKEFQETVPTFLYQFNINGNRASFEFAVLGSE
ncbi:MAG: hypothetical protein R3208_04950 [Ketobacteraceae bacterium]|nr:hypothetical protein [Ketobacteraceae bacterium]